MVYKWLTDCAPLLFLAEGLYYDALATFVTVVPHARRARFGAYTVDFSSCELYKYNLRIKIQDQPFQILATLLANPGELVTREQLRKSLWAVDTFVDFDAGLNAAVRKLRDTLSDSADQPRYIETVPRHGYRFIAAVETVPETGQRSSAPEAEAEIDSRQPPDSQPEAEKAATPVIAATSEVWRRRFGLWPIAFITLAGLLLILTSANWRSRFFSTRASVDIRSVAVLPLQNLSGDPNQEYFVDGMTDALITSLAQIKSLRVISRTSAMRYKGTQKKLPEIARELNVEAVIEGVVFRSGDRVRIDAQLIRADNDQHLWAKSYDRQISDILALQADVSRSIASEIQINLTPEEQLRQATVRPVNPEAYEDYLKGAYFFTKESSDAFEKAIQYLQKSIDTDPSYAPAYLALGETYGFMAYTNRLSRRKAYLKAEDLLAKSLALDPTSPKAHVLVGMIKLQFHCDRPGAEKELNFALQLDPANTAALDYHSFYLLEVGRTEEAIAEKKKALEHDPVAVGLSAELGLYFLQADRVDEAIQQLQKTLELDPNFAPAHMRLGMAYLKKEQNDLAIAECKKAIALDKTPTRIDSLAGIYFSMGKTREVRELLGELEQMSHQRYVAPTLMAHLYSDLGEYEHAMAWLQKAQPSDDPPISDSSFDRWRSDPRFKTLEARLASTDSCLDF